MVSTIDSLQHFYIRAVNHKKDILHQKGITFLNT